MKLETNRSRILMGLAAAMSLFLVSSADGQATRENAVPTAGNSEHANKGMLVRISEIQINPEYLEEYKAILKEESAASVELEAGVISIFPMFRRDNVNEIRILEIYTSREAYDAHIKSPQFQKYKTTTLNMVKSLKLVDMETIDPGSMRSIFKKM